MSIALWFGENLPRQRFMILYTQEYRIETLFHGFFLYIVRQRCDKAGDDTISTHHFQYRQPPLNDNQQPPLNDNQQPP